MVSIIGYSELQNTRHSPKCFIGTESVVLDLGEITSLCVNSVSPPCLNGVSTDGTVLRVLEDEKDQDRRECASGIEGSG
jgi:hypothetical protein